MPTEMEELADRAMDEMLRFGEGVIAYQTRDLQREDYHYSASGFDVMCHAFMAGAMLVISERYEFPTGPREIALLGLLRYLTEREGWKFKNAQARVAEINASGPDSIGGLAFEFGHTRWRNPDALRALFSSRKPKEWSSQSWADANRERSVRILKRLGLGLGVTALLLADWLLGRLA